MTEPVFRGCDDGCRTKKISPRLIRGPRCENCGSEKNLEVDHAIPKSRGGCECELNLWTLCRRCNRSKHALTITEFYESGLAEFLRVKFAKEIIAIDELSRLTPEFRGWLLYGERERSVSMEELWEML